MGRPMSYLARARDSSAMSRQSRRLFLVSASPKKSRLPRLSSRVHKRNSFCLLWLSFRLRIMQRSSCQNNRLNGVSNRNSVHLSVVICRTRSGSRACTLLNLWGQWAGLAWFCSVGDRVGMFKFVFAFGSFGATGFCAAEIGTVATLGFTSWNSGRLCSSSLLNFGWIGSSLLHGSSKSEWSLTGLTLTLTISVVYVLS